MISETVVELSRWQFVLSAMFYFLSIPLTLGLSMMMAILETLYVLKEQNLYKTACQFWGRIFAVNFIMGVAGRLVMVFQFGMNASYFSMYAGDIFALPLAIDAISSFFLLSVLFGPYAYGWERLTKRQHLFIIWCFALAVNLSVICLLVANGWLQNPVGLEFNPESFRLELTDFSLLLNNPVLVSKALHTISASYVAAAASVLAICAWLMLKNRQDNVASISYKLAAVIGLLAMLAVSIGDNTPDQANQFTKFAALNGNDDSSQLVGISSHIRNGIKAYGLLQEIRDDNHEPRLRYEFNQLKADLGYAWLLKHWSEHIIDASDAQITAAAEYCLPAHPDLLFWVYRFMIICGLLSFGWFASALWLGSGEKTPPDSWLKFGYYLLPWSWLACFSGWIVVELGKQPWIIVGVLPAFSSFSSASASEVIFSIISYAISYAFLLLFSLYLIRQVILFHQASDSRLDGL